MEISEKYPYFIYPDVLAVKEAVENAHATTEESERLMRLRRRIAANVGDIPALRLMLRMDPEEFARFYPDMEHATPSTADTIDSFLSKFGKPDLPVSEATAGIGTDKFSWISGTSGSMAVTGNYLTEETIPAAKDDGITTDKKWKENPTEKIPRTEADARICIKKHDYQTALKIIMHLSLNNPEKSIYFADQIRFLRKLILNQTKQNNSGR